MKKNLRWLPLFLGGFLVAFPSFIATAQPFTRITDEGIGTDRGNTLGAAWVDIDNDGDLDLYVVAAAGPQDNRLYLNTGDGTFAKVTDGAIVSNIGAAALGTCWADYDNDGDLDVFNAGAPNSVLFRNDGRSLFTRITDGDIGGATDNRGWSCAWGDYDDDGFVDLFIAHPAGFLGAPIPNTLFRNAGDGTFIQIFDTPITEGIAPYTVGNWTDFDDDGDLDLFIGSGPAAGTLGPDFLYRNLLAESGTASFERITDLPLNDMRDGQTWNFVDYDNDGDRDGFVTNYWGGLPTGLPANLYQNTNGSFLAVTEGPLVTNSGFGLANVWQDFDNDGDLDVFIAREAGLDNVLYQNEGSPEFTFTRTDDFAGTTTGNYGATGGDFDFDGDIDLFVPSHTGGGNYLYRNDTPADDAWVVLRLVGSASNRSGVGARVRARALIGGKPVWQQREVSTQDTFNGHNSLDVHFGFGDASIIDQVVIEWPSGTTETIRNIAPGAYYVATESAGLAPLSEMLLIDLRDRVAELVEAGILTSGQGSGLRTRLHVAIDHIRAGRETAALAAVKAFNNQVLAFSQAGFIGEEDKRFLLDPAGTIVTLLGGSVVSMVAEGNLSLTPAEETPSTFELTQNFPNPFNPSTSISFAVPEATHVRLTIYDMQGREVSRLVDGLREAGRHEVRWEPVDLASGLYLYRLETSSYAESRLMHLLK